MPLSAHIIIPSFEFYKLITLGIIAKAIPELLAISNKFKIIKDFIILAFAMAFEISFVIILNIWQFSTFVIILNIWQFSTFHNSRICQILNTSTLLNFVASTLLKKSSSNGYRVKIQPGSVSLPFQHLKIVANESIHFLKKNPIQMVIK